MLVRRAHRGGSDRWGCSGTISAVYTLQRMNTGLEGTVHSRVEGEQKLQNTTVHNEAKIRKYSLEQPSHVRMPIRQKPHSTWKNLKKRDEMLLFQFP